MTPHQRFLFTTVGHFPLVRAIMQGDEDKRRRKLAEAARFIKERT